MAALWALHQHSPHQVYIYEAAPRLGGHINTVEFKKGEDSVNVDTGFIVLNNSTYRAFPPPNLKLGLTEQPTFSTSSKPSMSQPLPRRCHLVFRDSPTRAPLNGQAPP